MSQIHTHYDNLKVARNAPQEVIRAAYKSLAQKYHPDRNPNSDEAVRIMKIINASYDVLSDEKQRREHDIWIENQENSYVYKQEELEQNKRAKNQEKHYFATSGSFHIDDLPTNVRKVIIDRVQSNNLDQIRLKLDGVVWRYIWFLICSLWFIYLFNDAYSYKWGEETNYWHIGFSILFTVVISRLALWIYSWHTTPLYSFLIVTPVYVVLTHLDKLWFWPIWTITDIKATHNYRNGWFQDTSLSMTFDGDLRNFSLKEKTAYDKLLQYLKVADTRVRKAIVENDVSYLKSNDDFWRIREINLQTNSHDENKGKIAIYLIAGLIGLVLYGVAFSINASQSSQTKVGSNSQTNNSPLSSTNYAPTPIQNQQNTLGNSAQGNKYIRPTSAPNGSPWPVTAGYVSGYQQLNKLGMSTVTVDNQRNNADVFVKLYLLVGSKKFVTRVFFIPAYSKFTVESLATGLYDVRYLDLDSGNLARTESFALEQTESYSGTEYSNITLTLYKVANGNMQTTKLSAEEF